MSIAAVVCVLMVTGMFALMVWDFHRSWKRRQQRRRTIEKNKIDQEFWRIVEREYQ